MLSRKKEVLGSVFEIKLPKPFFSLCFNELVRIEKTYSRFLDSSKLSKLNSNLNKWQTIDEEFLYLIKKSLDFNKKTNKSFDITLKSTLDDLGYDKKYSFSKKTVENEKNKINKKSSIKNKIKKINESVRNLVQNPIEIKKNKVLLRKEIDFGGLGKGFALDQLKNLLDKKNVEEYYLNAGGDIYGKGRNWEILLEHPLDNNKALGKIKLNDKFLAASSPSKRKWGKNHHLINSKTKKPANDILGVFVLADSGIEADAYATSLFTVNFKDAIKLSNKLNIDCLIISNSKKMYKTNDFLVEYYN